MAKRNSGLGRGLDSLFLSSEQQISDASASSIKLSDIDVDPGQPRKTFENQSLEQLSQSIIEHGVLQPIVLMPNGIGRYTIIAGERRFRAARMAGLTEVPVVIREMAENETMEIALIENIQREDLNPIEKARGIKQLMDEYDLTQQRVADILGKSRSAIANSVRILNLDERVINLALEGKLTEGHCRSLMSITDPEKQYEVAVQIIEQGDSVREVEKKVKVRKKAPKKAERYAPIYRDIEDSFQTFFGTKVKLDAGERKGKIIIQYSTNDDLARILELIK